MRESDRKFIIPKLIMVSDMVKKASVILCELVGMEEDTETVLRRVSILEDDADSLNRELIQFFSEIESSRSYEATAFYKMATLMEGIMDKIEDLSRVFYRYNVTYIYEDCVYFFVNAEKAANKLSEITLSFQKNGVMNIPVKDIVELDHYKVESLRMYDENMRKLISDRSNDPISILIWKEVFDSFQALFVAYENVSEELFSFIRDDL